MSTTIHLVVQPEAWEAPSPHFTPLLPPVTKPCHNEFLLQKLPELCLSISMFTIITRSRLRSALPRSGKVGSSHFPSFHTAARTIFVKSNLFISCLFKTLQSFPLLLKISSKSLMWLVFPSFPITSTDVMFCKHAVRIYYWNPKGLPTYYIPKWNLPSL